MALLGTAWPVRGLSGPGVIAMGALLVVVLALVPVALGIWKRATGSTIHLWPVAAFVVLASVYAVATPPWQMSDEPQHMVRVEVVRQAGIGAPQHLLPGAAPSPPAARALASADRAVVASMRATDAARYLPGAGPALHAGIVPGPREMAHPPLYYVVAAVLTKPFSGRPLLARLALLRAFGVLLAAMTVVVCGAVGRLLWPGRPLAEVPMALALGVPAFVATAGSVNNDGIAVLLGAVLVYVLLAGALGRSWLARPLPWAAAVVLVTIAGVATKRTFLPLVLLVLPAAAFRLRHRALAVGAGLVVLLLAAGLAFAAS